MIPSLKVVAIVTAIAATLLVGLFSSRSYTALAVNSGVVLAAIVALYLWALSYDNPKDQMLLGQSAILLAIYLVPVAAFKAMSIYVLRKTGREMLSYTLAACGLIPPAAYLYLMQVNTIFW